MYDIAIIGAGPAGATLARLIGKYYRVLLIEKRNLDQHHKQPRLEKCCGGLLAPDAQKMLAFLRLGLPEKILVGPQLFVVRTIDLQSGLERFYQRHYINIDREKFDRWLVSLIPGSVEIRTGCFLRSYELQDTRFRITFSKKNRNYHEYARVLIGADGATSIVRRHSFSHLSFPKQYIALQEWFTTRNAMPYFSAIFDRRFTDFYAWVIPKGDLLIMGVAFPTRGNVLERFHRLKERLTDYNFTFGKTVKRRAGVLFRPVNISQLCPGKGNIALVGEAGGWISPSSAEGLSYAFRSAVVLARVLQEKFGDFLKSYRFNIIPLRMNILAKNFKSPFMYDSVLRFMVMKSGIKSMRLDD